MPEPTTIKIEMDEMKKNAEEVAELLRVMAHPERLMVLCQLTQSEMGVGQLQQGSTLSQSAFHNTLLCCESTALSKRAKNRNRCFIAWRTVGSRR